MAALDDHTQRKLKRGKIEIDGKIDLHGMTQAEAYAALTRFISASVKKDRRTLLVITGKGRAPGSGVLRRLLPLWAAEFKDVQGLSPASVKDGGDGAFYVRLRKRKA